MEPITNEEVQEIFSCSSIEVADSSLGIGRQLTYVNPPLRTVVFQTVKSDQLEYISGAIALILEIEEEWLLIARYGSASSLQLIEAKEDFAAILFKNPDKSIL